ncbi:hypothetical protein [uncultured Nisaea sp.]|jgi:hypothetical protein|uniref:hypothetical protein n=1 Tax=uncultured Nisaea sp. TaxID=538215 RepID=UPI0030EEFCC7|tara:strand:- start:278 stop:709 length:432 start_codon:yes stop_codon:yes gene_type:complete
MKKLLIATVCAAALSACASNSDDIKAAYVSPIQYQNHTCTQLGNELDRLSVRLIEAAKVQDKEADEDVVATAAGAIIFLPILLFIDGDGAGAAELSRLKGEFDAIEQTAIKNDCDVQDKIKQIRSAQEDYQNQRSNQGKNGAS